MFTPQRIRAVRRAATPALGLAAAVALAGCSVGQGRYDADALANSRVTWPGRDLEPTTGVVVTTVHGRVAAADGFARAALQEFNPDTHYPAFGPTFGDTYAIVQPD